MKRKKHMREQQSKREESQLALFFLSLTRSARDGESLSDSTGKLQAYSDCDIPYRIAQENF